jgi:DNA (cytosine-5)-methyltransferase 1
MTEPIKLLELFSGIQSQERALRQLELPYESVGVCDCDKDVLVSSAAMRFNLDEEIANYNFPDAEIMIKELQDKNIGYDFDKSKHTITSRTSITKLRQYYISDKLLKNLGDISKVNKMPRANFVTYSSPCQSFSVAGKLAGAAKTCTKCGHKWDIDFNNPDYNYKCPICGSASLESTTSGLLQEVQRLLSIAYEENELPEYLLLENVKNLVGKKFIGQFEAWVKWLDSIGYNTYWEVLNGKQYGIPQNRERVFAISIRKDVDTKGFIFPETIPLATRLKDMLEQNVDEKYYLPDDRLEKILNSTFIQEKIYKYVSTKEPEVKQIVNVMPGTNRPNPNQGRVYDKEGIAPTLTKMDGGNRQPMVIDEIKVIGNYMPSNHDASRVVDIEGIAPTVKENHGTVTAIAEPIIYDDYNGSISADQDVINTLTTNCGMPTERNGVKIIEPIVCEERKDEGIRLFKDDCVGTLRTIDACGDKRVLEPEVTEPPKVKWRIRKLTPKECIRLMNFTDKDYEAMSQYVSNSAVYKQAGNSIIVACLIAIMSSLFIEDGHKAEVWTKYILNYDD